MLRLCLSVIAFLVCLYSSAQKITMENGEVLSDGKLFCSYNISGDKIKVVDFAGGELGEKRNPETSGVPFKDYSFRNGDDIPFVYITAKVLSSPSYMYLKYYYKVEFPGCDTSFCVLYHPYFIEFFTRDLSSHKVLANGRVDKQQALDLVRIWKNKPDAIDDNILATASSCNYNTSPYNIDNPKYNDNKYIDIRGNNIYVHDTLLGQYRISNDLEAHALAGNSANSRYYYIETPDGHDIVDFQLKKQHSAVYFWPAGYKSYLQLYTAVRDEKRLVWEVVNCIIKPRQ